MVFSRFGILGRQPPDPADPADPPDPADPADPAETVSSDAARTPLHTRRGQG